jgi:hypothetical protein
MASTAFTAQGSTFQIGTGTGSAETISGVTVGNPTILIITATTRLNGDVITIAGLTGANAAALNGLSLIVTNKTTNTVAVNVDTTGLTITAGAGTATPVTYTKVSNIKDYNGFDGKAAIIDVTNLDSVAKEKRIGLQDFGKITLTIDIDHSDAGQLALVAAKASGLQKAFKLNFSDSKVASFNGFVMSAPNQGAVDNVVKGTFDIEITGSVTVA